MARAMDNAILETILQRVRPLIGQGKVADYIPALASVEGSKLGIAICTVDGQHYQAGDAHERFSIQSISKVLSLVVAMRHYPEEEIWQRVGKDPSGSPFNSLVQLEMEQGIPRNPFINAGALVVCDMLQGRLSAPRQRMLEVVRALCGVSDITYDATVARSEFEHSARNAAIAWLMKSFGNFHHDVPTVLQNYFHYCALKMSCMELARTFVFLANQGEAFHLDEPVVTPMQARQIFAGLAFADMGSVDYGRNYGVLYDIGSWTDVLPEFGNDSYEASDNFMTGRANGVLTYRNNDFFGLVDGLNIALQYQGKNDGLSKEGDPLSNNARKSIAYQNGDGFGASATYDLGMGVSLGAAYTSSKRTLDQMTQDKYDNGDRAEAWTGGVKYDANNIYLAANYTRTYDMTYMGDTLGGFAHKTDNWEMVGQYQFDNGLRPSLAFLQSRANDVDGLGSFDLVKYIDVGSYYYFNKNMSAYVDYKINLLKDGNPSNPNTDNTVALGLVYEF